MAHHRQFGQDSFDMRGPTSTQRHATTVINQPRTLISEEPLNSWSHCASHNPALVIHMATQAFVRRSYAEPFEDVGFGTGRRVRSAN